MKGKDGGMREMVGRGKHMNKPNQKSKMSNKGMRTMRNQRTAR